MKRLAVLAIGMALFLSACQTTSTPSLPAQPIGGPVSEPDEIVMFDAVTPSMTRRACNGCDNNGGPVQLRLRLNGDNFIFQIAHAPSPKERFDPKKLYKLEVLVWFNGRPGISTSLRGFSFGDARRETGPDGQTWYVTDWMWSSVQYNITTLGKKQYIFGSSTDMSLEHRRKTLKAIRDYIAAGSTFKPWEMKLELGNFRGVEKHLERTLHGADAIAALKDPATAYEQNFAAMDEVIYEDKRKKELARDDNNAYWRFIRQELTPLTVNDMIKKAKCPDLGHRLQYNYHPIKDFYDGGNQSLRRAECYNKVLTDYDPDALINRYEQLSDQEDALFAKTHGIKRWSLDSALKQTGPAAREVRVAVDRAEYLFEGGDYTARAHAKQRANQRRERAQMQSLMSGLQGIQNTLQQRHDQAAARVAQLQAQGMANHRARLQAQRNQLSATSRSAASSATSSSSSRNTSSSSQQVAKATAPREPMIAVYMAASNITSAPQNMAHCDPGGAFDGNRIHEVKCRGVKVVRLPMLSPSRVKKCTGNPDTDVIDGHEGAIIGSIIRMEAVTRGELEKLRSIGKRQTNHLAGIFFEQAEPQATNELIEWKYEKTREGTIDRYFRDMTELRSYARNHNCAAILWTRADGSKYEERLDRVR
jgi:hypothetical protein